MGRDFFRFKQFLVRQEKAAMRVGTDGVLLGAWVDLNKVGIALDVGTGSGLIALQIAQRCDATIDAVEIDKSSAEQALANFHSSPWPNRLNVIHLSFQEYSNISDKKYDLIVSNPPYFNNSLKSSNSKRNLVRHTDDLSFDQLIGGVLRLLSPKGRFCVILPYVEGLDFINKSSSYGFFCGRKLNIQSIPSKPAMRILAEFSFEKKDYIEEQISIHTSDGKYTQEYKTLTGDFYLAF